MTFRERLENSFEQMMDYRTAVGYATATYRSSVPPFIAFCTEKYPSGTVITQGACVIIMTQGRTPYKIRALAI